MARAESELVTRALRSTTVHLGQLAWACALAWVCACENSSTASAPAPTSAEAASSANEAPLVEEREDGRIEWVVTRDGEVRARVLDAKGAVLSADVRAELHVGDDTIALALDGEHLVGRVALQPATLTTVEYSLVVGSATWTGTLHVPPGGTAELVATAPAELPPDGVGPNGGVIEVIEGQRVELLIDEESGEVRVYLLDENNRPIDVAPDAEAVIAIAE